MEYFTEKNDPRGIFNKPPISRNKNGKTQQNKGKSTRGSIKVEEMSWGVGTNMDKKLTEQYDKIPDGYATFEKYNPRKHILIGRVFERTFKNLKGKSVLDLGSGLGFFAILAKSLKANYVLGVDISQRILALAKAKARKAGFDIDYKWSDIIDLNAERKFDIVTAGFVFNYAPNRITLRKYLATASRHLKKGGILFSVLCNPDNPLRDKKILYRVVQVANGKLKDGSKLRCEFYDKRGNLLCHDYKFLWERKTIEGILRELGFIKIEWINIENINNKQSKVPRLPSTNIILYAIKNTEIIT